MADSANKNAPTGNTDKRKAMEERIQKGALHGGGDFIPIPGTVSCHEQAKRDVERGKKEEESEGRGMVNMIASMNVTKSIADIERRAKILNPTFETDAWYKSMQPGKNQSKAKSDDLER